jgi:U3 small nucleolar RNA-associated protein 11
MHRNAMQSKTHQERSQPASRSKWGLLEKHKDYVLRARDYHKKEKAITTLKRKAAFKNPDEFYFGMIPTATQKGIHVQQRNQTFEPELIQLLKTQDQNYISYQKSVNVKVR